MASTLWVDGTGKPERAAGLFGAAGVVAYRHQADIYARPLS
jgi:hypothetical protein